MRFSRLLTTAALIIGVLSLSAWLAVDAADGERIDFGGHDIREVPLWIQAQLTPKKPPAVVPRYRLSLKASQEDWAALVDETWGEGVSTGRKLEIFDRFWSKIDQSFACFQDLEVDWRGLRALYRPEVAAGVSRGRFAAIMSRLSLALMEEHTKAMDYDVTHTRPDPGVPLLHVGAFGGSTHFGAGLTPLPDKSLLVYTTLPAHPLGLEPGDIVLGYEGRPWSELYPELLELGLPVEGNWGSSPETFEHAWLMAAGLNWHLFDTIDVKKYETGEVLHLPTSPMEGLDDWLWTTEQLPIDGVPFPDFDNGQLISWGIIEGTQIGYIYGWGWIWDAEQEFFDAVHQLMFENDTEGLIIDFRFNMGGNMLLSDRGLELLFDRDVETIDWVERCDDADHFGLCSLGIPFDYVIRGDPTSFYDRPIAVLTGPGAVSSGDQVALRLKFHPNARFFGKSTNTAFNAPEEVFLDSLFYADYARYDAFLLSNPGEYLTHDPFLVDQPVWLNPEDVANGRDTVVEAAVRWIRRSNPSAKPRGRATRRVGSR